MVIDACALAAPTSVHSSAHGSASGTKVLRAIRMCRAVLPDCGMSPGDTRGWDSHRNRPPGAQLEGVWFHVTLKRDPEPVSEEVVASALLCSRRPMPGPPW